MVDIYLKTPPLKKVSSSHIKSPVWLKPKNIILGGSTQQNTYSI